MRHIYIVSLVLVVALLLSSCGRKRAVIVTETYAELEEATPVIAFDSAIVAYSYTFSISFISKGEGVKHALIEQVDATINPLLEAGYLQLDRIEWGREGEIDYCVRVIAIPPDLESELYTFLQEMDTAEELMFFSPDGSCLHKR
jgi:hypothetical protein